MLELRDIRVRVPKLAYTFLLLKLTRGRFHSMFDFEDLLPVPALPTNIQEKEVSTYGYDTW